MLHVFINIYQVLILIGILYIILKIHELKQAVLINIKGLETVVHTLEVILTELEEHRKNSSEDISIVRAKLRNILTQFNIKGVDK